MKEEKKIINIFVRFFLEQNVFQGVLTLMRIFRKKRENKLLSVNRYPNTFFPYFQLYYRCGFACNI